MFWKLEGLNADLTLVANSKAVEFNPMDFCIPSADHDVALATFHHISRAMQRVRAIIGDGDVFFAVNLEGEMVRK